MKYKHLSIGEPIKKGDEFFCCDECGWCKVSSHHFFKKVPEETFIYRRPVKENHPNTSLFK